MDKTANKAAFVARLLIRYRFAIILFLIPAFDTTSGQPDTGFEEARIDIETWMTEPFKTEIFEEPLELESWMTAPFEAGIYEKPLEIEAWMTEPFEIEKTYTPFEATTCKGSRKNAQVPDPDEQICCN